MPGAQTMAATTCFHNCCTAVLIEACFFSSNSSMTCEYTWQWHCPGTVTDCSSSIQYILQPLDIARGATELLLDAILTFAPI